MERTWTRSLTRFSIPRPVRVFSVARQRSKSVGVKFQRQGDVQSVERAQAEVRGVAARELCANIKYRIWNRNLAPVAIFAMELKAGVVLVRFASRERASKDVLFDSLCPFGNVKAS